MNQSLRSDKPFALIIEDDQKIATLFANALETVGYETEIVRDGQLALTRLTAITPNTVVLDLHLPNVSGRDILAHIRGDKRFTQTRVMIITADAILAESLSEDADIVLLKPINFTQLRDLAARLRPAHPAHYDKN
jgi:DNA-binding response OmpR family regulator